MYPLVVIVAPHLWIRTLERAWTGAVCVCVRARQHCCHNSGQEFSLLEAVERHLCWDKGTSAVVKYGPLEDYPWPRARRAGGFVRCMSWPLSSWLALKLSIQIIHPRWQRSLHAPLSDLSIAGTACPSISRFASIAGTVCPSISRFTSTAGTACPSIRGFRIEKRSAYPPGADVRK